MYFSKIIKNLIHYDNKKKNFEELREDKLLNQAKREVPEFEALLNRFERNISVLGKSQSTFENYARHVASISLYFGKIPTQLDPEQVQDYLYFVQKKSKTPSQSYFKHTVYGLRFLLKSEGLPYEFLRLPSIKHEKKLPVVLSKEEVWQMLQKAKLLKHKILIGLLYGCGLRCMEVRNVRIQDLDFDRKQLRVVQGKGKKDRYVPLSEHLIRGLKVYLEAEKPKDWIFNGQPLANRAGGDFDSRYSQRGVQWAIKQASALAGIKKEVCVHTLRHSYATHLLEDGLDIVSLKNLLGHENIETTMEYLQIAQLSSQKVFSPLDTLFEQCSRLGK
ncbi:MAG: tyrosine-type recombinase/integrase [Flectobacillus sp.]|uniref:tyrosine-type recombinase/integrase n=1 Tax=Flectobacillus sp. TaxID=50419 RepID=UPI003B9A183B